MSRRRGVAAAVLASSVAMLGAAPAVGQKNEAQGSSADGPDIVKVGVLIQDIQQLELPTHSYSVDMYMWFRWDNPDLNPAATFEFMNAYELWGHITTKTYIPPKQLPDGSYYQVIRNQGKFNAKLPLGDYPFDEQHLLVEIEDSVSSSEDLVFVPDKDPVAMTEGISLPGWDFGTPSLTVVTNAYDSDFGDPTTKDQTYSRVIVDIPVNRPHGTYALKLLLPMLLVAMTAALALALHPRYVEGRIGIGITALLTLVALQLTSNSSLPEVNYLLLLDKLYILSYGFVVLTMAVIVRNSWVDATGDVARATSADRRGLLWISVAYFGIAILLFVTSVA